METLEFDVVVGALMSEEVRRKLRVQTLTLETIVDRGRSSYKGDKLRGVSNLKSKGKKSKI